jgi:hypothetical protein
MIRQCVRLMHERFDAGTATAVISELVRHDRFQTSDGIMVAAEYVAQEAERQGLTGVEVIRFPADGVTKWWTFAAPPGWSPWRASLTLADQTGSRGEQLLAYPEQANVLAAYSAATPAGGVHCSLLPWSRRSDRRPGPTPLIVLDRPVPWPQVLAAAREACALGVVVGPGHRHPELVQRVELPPGSPLVAFSVTMSQLSQLLECHASGGTAWVTVDARPTPAEFPVVVAHTPRGDKDRPVLVVAHLCHPAPGANDNASGVAVALGVGSLLRDRPLRRQVSLVFGPEFLGMAAYLHRQIVQHRDAAPIAAVNLDMVGEDQDQCGGPLIVERSPNHLPSFLNAVAEECAQELPQAAWSYSGAVPCDTWALRVTPFAGASDHGLLADPAIGCPAVQLGHWPDRFRHTSGDTPDKVDAAEMRRSAAIAASTVALIAEADRTTTDALADVVTAWAARQLLSCLPGAGGPVRDTRRAASCAPVIDPHALALRPYRLRRLHEVAVGSVLSLADLGAVPDLLAARADWLTHLSRHVGLVNGTAPAPPRAELADDQQAWAQRAWQGPFNLRGLLADCTLVDQAWLQRELELRRESAYATMLAIANAADGTSDDDQIGMRAAVDSELAIDADFVAEFLAVLTRAGWLSRPVAPAQAGA